MPSLPVNSFSAEKWNTDIEIPAVSYVTSKDTEGISVIFPNGDKDLIDIELIPTYPIVVVKENEKIIRAEISNSTKKANLLKINYDNPSTTPLQFLDEAFDNLNKMEDNGISTAKNKVIPEEIPRELKQVFDAFDAMGLDNWLRDYVYYNLSPSTTIGKFSSQYMEHIVGFEMMGDALATYRKIADQDDDPKAIDGIHPPGRGRGTVHWTDGEFEFKVKVYIGTKNPTGSEFITYFRAKPSDLFEISYKQRARGAMYINSMTSKRLQLSLPLFEWNLEIYSATIKIAIEEVDATQTTKSTTSTTSEFAGNFEYNTTWGEIVKKGLKFGTSAKETRTNSFDVSTTWGNDELGEVMVNFGDPIIITNDNLAPVKPERPSFNSGESSSSTSKQDILPNYNPKYQTGWHRIYVTPKQIY